MLLAIDCGNTNTVFSIWDGAAFIGTWRTSTEHQRTADQYYVWLSTLMAVQKLDVLIDEVIISSTVPRVVFNLRVLADSSGSIEARRVGKDVIVERDSSGAIDVVDVGGDFTVEKDSTGGIHYDNVDGKVSLPN